MKQFKIGTKILTNNPFIIAEAGINHNGDLKLALKMIETAANSGVDAIKFQTFKAKEFVSDHKQTYSYFSNGTKITESMLEMFSRYEFEKKDWYKIKKKCDEEKIIFLSTPQNVSDLELLQELKIKALKIGSDDFTNIPLIKEFLKTKLPLMLSCGMANKKEIKQTMNLINWKNGYPVALLLTTSQYPTPPKDVNILKFQSLKKLFPNLKLGYSDHTQDNTASILALGMGATIFEKHFTLDNNFNGPDHWFSANPIKLKNWCESIKISSMMLGNNRLQPTNLEEKNKNEFRRFIVAIEEIKKDEKFSTKNIGMRRIKSKIGLMPIHFPSLINKRSKKQYKKGEIISN